MARLLPAGLVDPSVEETPPASGLGSAWAFHFDLNCCGSPGYAHFVVGGGKPVLLDSTESVFQWARTALAVERSKYRAYSSGFGSEFSQVLGRRGIQIETDVERVIIEALQVDPRISQVRAEATLTPGQGVRAKVVVQTVDGQEFSLDDFEVEIGA